MPCDAIGNVCAYPEAYTLCTQHLFCNESGKWEHLGRSCPGTFEDPACSDLPVSTDIVVRGEDLQEWEGVTVYVATENDGCTVSSSTFVHRGSFTSSLVGKSSAMVYPAIAAFFDLDDNGSCDPGTDLAWHVIDTIVNPPLEHELTPDTWGFGPADESDCKLFE